MEGGSLSRSPLEAGLCGWSVIRQRKASYHVLFRKATDRERGGGAGSSFLTVATNGAAPPESEAISGGSFFVHGVQVCSSEGIVGVCGLVLAGFSVDETLTH